MTPVFEFFREKRLMFVFSWSLLWIHSVKADQGHTRTWTLCIDGLIDTRQTGVHTYQTVSLATSILLCSVHRPGLQSQFDGQFSNKHSSFSTTDFLLVSVNKKIKKRYCIYSGGMNSALVAFCRIWQLLFVLNDTHWSSTASGGATTHPQLCPVGFWWKIIIL